MSSPALHRLLVVDDEPDLRTLYELTLLREGYDVETAGTVGDAWQHLQEQTFSAVITDMRLPDGTGLDLLRRLEAAGRHEKSIVITAYGSAENAVSALKSGAYDYLTKPVDLKQFRSVVAAAIASDSLAQPVPGALASAASASSSPATPARCAPPPSRALSRLAGGSAPIQQVRDLIEKVARSMAPVMLWGESGTGKELVARAIHDVSVRAERPFIPVNCGAIPEQLLEAEFFGYRKGAFTGAQEDREGFFQAAHGGTLFLDEIGDLPLAMQSKLLRAIQERAVRPVGATQEIAVDVRLLSATHKDLQAEVKAGRFRQDLYYRLNVIQITLPALRERLEDLPELSARILERIAHETGMHAPATLSPRAMQALMQHPFPGNVRELENLLQRAVALSNHAILEAEDLGIACATETAQDATFAPDSAFEPTQPAPLTELAAPAAPTAEPEPLPSDLATHLDHIERDILVRALEKHRYNRTAAGASLGLSLRQMRYRMARLGVQITDHGVVLGERFDPDAE
ncbi:MAG: sigma-54 dependent transcriptional regulator [Aquabacterium sp.]|jgi:two-component system response regulator PilR (NtrC family)|uniref:sigma-54-dependent transcriptional regulator n=1 Tax=Aquabacterium sp. TaxID=1872578 RepID=UPI002A35E45B|nr:sigma-54 dependent transcriptional regulator [Aquabacterium sp.]MDX9844514.1 sigma-54 dependent transcriptional regulator [Aquabacterium sp.]